MLLVGGSRSALHNSGFMACILAASKAGRLENTPVLPRIHCDTATTTTLLRACAGVPFQFVFFFIYCFNQRSSASVVGSLLR